MEALGGPVCSCCGESNQLFLTIDHVHNDGKEHRRNTRDVRAAMMDAIKRPERYTVLCFNCNCGRARNGGICPHVC